MTFTPVKTPLIAKKLFPNYIWDVSTNKKIIYLTFDDGPTPEITDWTLEVLNQYNAKATFFCIGNNVKNHPEIFQNIIRQGHAVGNHTHNHLKGWQNSVEVYLDNIKKAEETIHHEISNSSIPNYEVPVVNLFRPPYGQITLSQGKKLMELGYHIVMWDVLSYDWNKDLKLDNSFKNLISKITKGSIVVFHDSIKASKNLQYLLPKVLDHFSEKGYVFKPLTI